jgi:predicted alpha/beta-fold hydrolase
MISSECYTDVKEYINFVCNQNPDKKVFAVGFSFGGLLLAKFLGVYYDKIPANFLAGTGICYPCCLEETKNYAEIHFNGLYSKASLTNIKSTFNENIDSIFDSKTHKGIKNSEYILSNKEKFIKAISGCILYSDFDRIWTTNTLGLNHVSEYYKLAKVEQYVSKIKIPFLSIFTEDDPIIPINSVPFKTLQANPNTVTVVTQNGGHLGFFGGMLFPQRVLDQPIRTFLKTVQILKETEGVCEEQ